MYIENYELRFRVLDLKEFLSELMINFKDDLINIEQHFIIDKYIRHNYSHLQNIRLRRDNENNYLIYKLKSNHNKEQFYILNVSNIKILDRMIMFDVCKKRIIYNYENFKIIIDKNIVIKKKNIHYFCSQVAEFEYNTKEYANLIKKIIDFFQGKKIISRKLIDSTYNRMLNEICKFNVC